MTVQPAAHIFDKRIRIGFELQRVRGLGVFDNLLVVAGKLIDVAPCQVIIDNSVLSGQQKQNGYMHLSRQGPERSVQENACGEKPRRRRAKTEWVVADELLPAGCESKELRILQRHGKEPLRRHEPPPGESQ